MKHKILFFIINYFNSIYFFFYYKYLRFKPIWIRKRKPSYAKKLLLRFIKERNLYPTIKFNYIDSINDICSNKELKLCSIENIIYEIIQLHVLSTIVDSKLHQDSIRLQKQINLIIYYNTALDWKIICLLDKKLKINKTKAMYDIRELRRTLCGFINDNSVPEPIKQLINFDLYHKFNKLY